MSPELPRLEPRRLAPPGSLAGDLLDRREAARGLLPDGALPEEGDGASREGLAGAARERTAEPRLPPEPLATSGPEAELRLREVLEGNGVLVTTGQQPVLFLGPLFVIYKALTAVALAERLRAEGTPALALFWVGGDDHDWEEVGRTRILDLENRLRDVRLEPPEDREGRAVGPTRLGQGIAARLDEIFQVLPDSEFSPSYLELFREAYRPGRSVSGAFGAALSGVLEGQPFAWLEAASPAVRRASSPLYRRVLSEPSAVEEAFLSATRAVRKAGYDPPIHRDGGGVPLFVDRPSGRTRLLLDEAGGLRLGRDGEVVGRRRVLEELERHPERFSASVALRPVLASWLLPTAVTVLGPGELAYWTQLPELFRWADVPFPRLRPRAGWTVIEAKVEKVLEKLGAGTEAFEDGGAELTRRVRERGRPERVQRSLDGARREVQAALAEVGEAVEAELPGLRSAVGAARHEAFRALDRLQDAVDRRVEEQNQVLLRQIRKAAVHLWPEGRPQERVLSPLYHLARYGPAFVEHVARRTGELVAGPAGRG